MKPADTLIKKVSAAIGGFFVPYQIKRVAKAEAEAALIKAQSDIQITELHRRAIHRFVEEESQKQQNIEAITCKALPHLNEATDASKIDDDWVVNFFDKSRIVSDSDMQERWARILAGEANAPGSFSKRTVNLLGDLDKADATLFSALCRFVWDLGFEAPLVFKVTDAIYTSEGLSFYDLTHLDSLGLVRFDNVSGFSATLPAGEKLTAAYDSTVLSIFFEEGKSENLDLGKVLFTSAGRQLSSICKSNPVPGFVDYVKTKWADFSPIDVSK